MLGTNDGWRLIRLVCDEALDALADGRPIKELATKPRTFLDVVIVLLGRLAPGEVNAIAECLDKPNHPLALAFSIQIYVAVRMPEDLNAARQRERGRALQPALAA